MVARCIGCQGARPAAFDIGEEELVDIIPFHGPPFLGLVRKSLSKPTRQRVVHEIGKDLVHGPVEQLVEQLPTAETRPG